MLMPDELEWLGTQLKQQHRKVGISDVATRPSSKPLGILGPWKSWRCLCPVFAVQLSHPNPRAGNCKETTYHQNWAAYATISLLGGTLVISVFILVALPRRLSFSQLSQTGGATEVFKLWGAELVHRRYLPKLLGRAALIFRAAKPIFIDHCSISCSGTAIETKSWRN